MRSPEEQLEDEVAVLKRRLEASEAQAASRLEEIESLLESLRVQQDRTRAAREALRPEVTNITPEVVRVGDLPIRVIENPAFRWDQALIVSGGKVYAYNVTTGQTKVVSERLPDGRWTHES